MTTARFITIEGIEGVGKSSAVATVRAVLEAAGIDYIVTREPGGTPLSEKIRDVLLARDTETVSDMTELLLMFACRAQNIQNNILPALAAGQWVVCDRYTDATFAYQGGGRGLPVDRIQTLADWVQGDVMPDCTLLLDAPVAVGMSRLTGEKDRIEQEKAAFFERTRAVYLERANAAPERFRVIAADRPMEIVAEDVRQAVESLL